MIGRDGWQVRLPGGGPTLFADRHRHRRSRLLRAAMYTLIPDTISASPP